MIAAAGVLLPLALISADWMAYEFLRPEGSIVPLAQRLRVEPLPQTAVVLDLGRAGDRWMRRLFRPHLWLEGAARACASSWSIHDPRAASSG